MRRGRRAKLGRNMIIARASLRNSTTRPPGSQSQPVHHRLMESTRQGTRSASVKSLQIIFQVYPQAVGENRAAWLFSLEETELTPSSRIKPNKVLVWLRTRDPGKREDSMLKACLPPLTLALLTAPSRRRAYENKHPENWAWAIIIRDGGHRRTSSKSRGSLRPESRWKSSASLKQLGDEQMIQNVRAESRHRRLWASANTVPFVKNSASHHALPFDDMADVVQFPGPATTCSTGAPFRKVVSHLGWTYTNYRFTFQFPQTHQSERHQGLSSVSRRASLLTPHYGHGGRSGLPVSWAETFTAPAEPGRRAVLRLPSPSLPVNSTKCGNTSEVHYTLSSSP